MVAAMNAGEAGGGAADAGRRQVERVFSSVARSYDLMNDLMSLGAHRLWRREAVAALRLRPGARALDLAGGTGDMAFRLGPRAGLTAVCDANPAMLGEGRRRRGRGGDDDAGRPVWSCADAGALPFAGATFDAAAAAFGIRNMPGIDEALAEVARVLRPCGRFVCLEFGPAVVPALAPAYAAWSRFAIPALGAAVAGDRAAYEYLVESIRRFPPPEALSAALSRAGFAGVRARALSGGIVWLHCGWRV